MRLPTTEDKVERLRNQYGMAHVLTRMHRDSGLKFNPGDPDSSISWTYLAAYKTRKSVEIANELYGE